jgi:hypothetical protein
MREKNYLEHHRVVAIVGSRGFKMPDLIESLFSLMGNDKRYQPGGDGHLIVTGGAPGVDTEAIRCAKEWAFPYLVIPARWNFHGKGAAGMIRNADIVDMADVVVAFWDGESRGTANVIDRARRRNKPLVLITTVFNEVEKRWQFTGHAEMHQVFNPENWARGQESLRLRCEKTKP